VRFHGLGQLSAWVVSLSHETQPLGGVVDGEDDALVGSLLGVPPGVLGVPGLLGEVGLGAGLVLSTIGTLAAVGLAELLLGSPLTQ